MQRPTSAGARRGARWRSRWGRGSHVRNINLRFGHIHGAISNEDQAHVEDEWAASLVVT